jgi:hypothetical protein
MNAARAHEVDRGSPGGRRPPLTRDVVANLPERVSQRRIVTPPYRRENRQTRWCHA